MMRSNLAASDVQIEGVTTLGRLAATLALGLLCACIKPTQFKVREIVLATGDGAETVLALDLWPQESVNKECVRLELADRDMRRVRCMLAAHPGEKLQVKIDGQAVLTSDAPSASDVGDVWLMLRGRFHWRDIDSIFSEPVGANMTVGVRNDTNVLLHDVVVRYEGGYRFFGDVEPSGTLSIVHMPRFVPLDGDKVTLEYSVDGVTTSTNYPIMYRTHWSGSLLACVGANNNVEWVGKFIPQ